MVVLLKVMCVLCVFILLEIVNNVGCWCYLYCWLDCLTNGSMLGYHLERFTVIGQAHT